MQMVKYICEIWMKKGEHNVHQATFDIRYLILTPSNFKNDFHFMWIYSTQLPLLKPKMKWKFRGNFQVRSRLPLIVAAVPRREEPDPI